MRKRQWWLLLGLAGLSACATANAYPPPGAGQFASVEGTVAEARARGADTTLPAEQHLRLAEVQLAQAKQHLAAGDNQGAALLLARADADAELSRALQRQTDATTAAVTTEAELQETRAQTPPAVAPPAQP